VEPTSRSKADGGATAPPNLVDEIGGIVEQNFYSPARLERIGWRSAVGDAREAFLRTPDATARTTILRDLLAKLGASHTGYYPRSDPTYWQLSSLYEPVLERTCAKGRTPGFPIMREDIGVFWKQVEGQWFVGGVFPGSPADKAGLKLGDRVLMANQQAFSPVASFAGRANQPVSLQVRRRRDGPPITIVATPISTGPHEELRQATADSWRILEHKGHRIAYLHVWSWATKEMHQVVLDAIAKSNVAAVDGFILDIRDGWGGAHVQYLAIFWNDIPLLERRLRDGGTEPFDLNIRKPAVLLINSGTRSGKETFAYGAKKHRLARLIGERTYGGGAFGQPFCLSDGSLMYLAVAEALLDGEQREGRGVAPDIEVRFDFRYAAGNDPQLARALEVLTGEHSPAPAAK
jgi:C-terminal processing protease CtpA/Prc